MTGNVIRYFWTGQRLTTPGVIACGGGGAILGIIAVELLGVWELAALFAVFAVFVPLVAARSRPTK